MSPTAAPALSADGRRVGRYEIIRQIGRGGMATVYLARQESLNREVALKELSSFHAGAPDMAQRFLQESRLAGSLNHPNIVTVLEYFEEGGIPYIAMEYVRRGSLRPYVGKLSSAQLVGVLEGVLAGLAHAETQGIVHRDLKPENLMVTADGRVKITDFGIAKATQSAGTGVFLTAAGTTVGTPTYMAPEQAMGRDIGIWTDLYSLGIMTWEHVVGRVPFYDSDVPLVILTRQLNEQIPPAVQVTPDADPDLSAWIDRLLVKDAAHRVRSPLEAWDELEEIIIAKLGPRWRREARLPSPSQVFDTPQPLTPAPFESEKVRTPEPAGPASRMESSAPSAPPGAGPVTPVAPAAPQPPPTPPTPVPAVEPDETPVARAESAYVTYGRPGDPTGPIPPVTDPTSATPAPTAPAPASAEAASSAAASVEVPNKPPAVEPPLVEARSTYVTFGRAPEPATPVEPPSAVEPEAPAERAGEKEPVAVEEPALEAAPDAAEAGGAVEESVLEVEPDVAGAEGAVAEPEAEVGLPAEGETLPGLHPWPGIESLPEAEPGPEREPEPVGDAEAEAEAGPPTGAVKEQERLRAAPDVIARRRTVALAGVAVVAAAVIGFIVSPSSGGSPPAPAPVLGSASSGPISVLLPAGWQRENSAPATPGLSLANELIVAPTRPPGGALVIGTGATSDASLLPASFLSVLQTTPSRQVVTLGGRQFYRYLGLSARGTTESVYALPTTAGTVIGACLLQGAGNPAFPTGCERVLGSLRLHGATALGLGPSSSLATELSGVVTRLNTSVTSGQARLRKAGKAASQASAAGELAAAYDRAAAALRKLSPGPAEAAAVSALAGALAKTGHDYSSLSGAASHNDGAAYNAARRVLDADDSAVSAAFAQLAKLGYVAS